MKSLLLFLFFSSSIYSYEYEISIISVTKDDHPYLAEWIEYHKLIGVDHFYIYDNNNDNQTKEVLDPYIKEGTVEYIKWPNLWPTIPLCSSGGCIIQGYHHALEKSAGRTKWLAIIDTDEFIVPTKYNSLKETLIKEYESHKLIYVNWRMFGTSNKYLPPPTLILPFLTKCSNKNLPFNKWGKAIVRPEYLKEINDYHIGAGVVSYVDGSAKPFPYSSWKEINQSSHPVNDDFLRINHYTFRDKWFFYNFKIKRGLSWNPYLNLEQYGQELMYYDETYNVEECRRILELIEYHTKKNRSF